MAETRKKQQPVQQRKIPQRRCVGCQGTFDKRDLLRVVRAPDGTISLDFTGKKSGRGAYLCLNEACFKKAKKSGILSRSLECEISPEIYEALEHEIRAAAPEGE